VRLECLLGSVKSSRLGVCHRVHLRASVRASPGVYLRTYVEVYLGAYSQAGWECTIERYARYLQVS